MEQADDSRRYQHVVERIDQLPAFPAIVTRLVEVINSPDSSAEDAAELIEKDPALTSKMLRLANSAFYGMPRTISSVNSAVVILGFNAIRSIVLGATLMKMFSPTDGCISFDKSRFWMHSIVTAMAAKAIMRRLLHTKLMDPETAFCAGMLHDIGKLIFDQFLPDDYVKVCTYARTSNCSLLQSEFHLMGTSHSQIGRIIADKWALPLDLEYAIVHHHQPRMADKFPDLIAAVHVADSIAHKTGNNTLHDEVTSEVWHDALKMLELDATECDRIGNAVKNEFDKSREFYSIMA